MDKRTRVFNAMEKKPVDHVPVGFWYHFEGEQTLGEPCVRAHVDYVRDCDLDMVKIMCDSYFQWPMPDAVLEGGDWSQLRPLGREHPFIAEQLERARRIAEEVGGEMPVFYNVFAPFSCIRNGAGEERVMADLWRDPTAVMRALDVIAQDSALLAELLIRESGCDGVYYCVQGGEKGRFTPAEYRRMIRPSDLYVLEHANRFSAHNILHCCSWAGERNNLELWRDYPAACVNWGVWVEEFSLPDGRFFFGDRACLGGFESLHREGRTHKGTEAEIRAFTRDLILTFGKRGLILGADCTVNSHIDHSRIRWVTETAHSI